MIRFLKQRNCLLFGVLLGLVFVKSLSQLIKSQRAAARNNQYKSMDSFKVTDLLTFILAFVVIIQTNRKEQ